MLQNRTQKRIHLLLIFILLPFGILIYANALIGAIFLAWLYCTLVAIGVYSGTPEITTPETLIYVVLFGATGLVALFRLFEVTWASVPQIFLVAGIANLTVFVLITLGLLVFRVFTHYVYRRSFGGLVGSIIYLSLIIPNLNQVMRQEQVSKFRSTVTTKIVWVGRTGKTVYWLSAKPTQSAEAHGFRVSKAVFDWVEESGPVTICRKQGVFGILSYEPCIQQ